MGRIYGTPPKNFTPDYVAYTDGGYLWNFDIGASACLILKDGEQIYSWSKASRRTTNNRQELAAIIHAVLHTPEGSKLLIRTDSEYCIGVYSRFYSINKNAELIEFFFKYVEERNLTVAFEWVQGHNGDIWNEIVDEMCTEAMERNK